MIAKIEIATKKITATTPKTQPSPLPPPSLLLLLPLPLPLTEPVSGLSGALFL